MEVFIYTRLRPHNHDVIREYAWKNKGNVRFMLFGFLNSPFGFLNSGNFHYLKLLKSCIFTKYLFGKTFKRTSANIIGSLSDRCFISSPSKSTRKVKCIDPISNVDLILNLIFHSFETKLRHFVVMLL